MYNKQKITAKQLFSKLLEFETNVPKSKLTKVALQGYSETWNDIIKTCIFIDNKIVKLATTKGAEPFFNVLDCAEFCKNIRIVCENPNSALKSTLINIGLEIHNILSSPKKFINRVYIDYLFSIGIVPTYELDLLNSKNMEYQENSGKLRLKIAEDSTSKPVINIEPDVVISNNVDIYKTECEGTKLEISSASTGIMMDEDLIDISGLKNLREAKINFRTPTNELTVGYLKARSITAINKIMNYLNSGVVDYSSIEYDMCLYNLIVIGECLIVDNTLFGLMLNSYEVDLLKVLRNRLCHSQGTLSSILGGLGLVAKLSVKLEVGDSTG